MGFSIGMIFRSNLAMAPIPPGWQKKTNRRRYGLDAECILELDGAP